MCERSVYMQQELIAATKASHCALLVRSHWLCVAPCLFAHTGSHWLTTGSALPGWQRTARLAAHWQRTASGEPVPGSPLPAWLTAASVRAHTGSALPAVSQCEPFTRNYHVTQYIFIVNIIYCVFSIYHYYQPNAESSSST